MVAPPSTTTRARLTHSMVSTRRARSLSQATCASVATITTIVASSTGASFTPTTLPDTRNPRWLVAKAAAHSLLPLCVLEGREEQDDGQEVEEDFHALGGAVAGAAGLAAQLRQDA